MTRLFGTDGVRGKANVELTPDLVLALGRAAGLVLAPDGGEVVVGRDTRLSGPMLEAALTAGLSSAGVRVALAGILPTPAVAYLTSERQATAGAVISASHNPVGDNGIKFFSDEGTKLSSGVEEQIEKTMEAPPEDLPVGVAVGAVISLEDAASSYLGHLAASVHSRLEGMKVALDLAHGAACRVAPEAFRAAGAEVVTIHDTPDGSRINVDCGSTSLSDLATFTTDEGARLGLAFDGDADRVLAVDENGAEIDGDRIIGVSALHLKERGELAGDVVVLTVMSNLGLVRALEQRGIRVISAPVGDRFVAEAMLDEGATVGGEQSGHVIFSRYAATGDGILTGLQFAQAVAASQAPVSELSSFYTAFPQVLINVPVTNKEALASAETVWEGVARAERELGEEGRVLVRASGTEPLVRVMVEAADEGVAARVARDLAATVEAQIGA